jgi:hypothetical protein
MFGHWTKWLICWIVLSCSYPLQAQETGTEIPKQTELIIPVSPAYQMLDAGSALVNSPGTVRDFKVDWSFKTYRLAPNLAIEAQPVWNIFYNRPTLDKYQRAGKFMQTLSTLSLSAGSLDANDSIRLLAWAGKITLWRGYDPLASKEWYNEIEVDYINQRTELESRLNITKENFKNATSRFVKDSLDLIISQIRMEMDQLKAANKVRIREKQQQLKARYWNRSSIDVAYGKSYTFNRNISERLDSVRLKNRSNSIWVNGAFGVGRHVLISGLVRMENINILMPDSGKTLVRDQIIDDFTGDTTFIERDSLFVNFANRTKNILSFGLNIRFGNPTYSFFMEGMFTKSIVPVFTASKWEAFNDYGEKGRIKSSQIVSEIVVAFGGEWRVSNSVLLSYGIRSSINKGLRFKNIFPLASISCLMR